SRTKPRAGTRGRAARHEVRRLSHQRGSRGNRPLRSHCLRREPRRSVAWQLNYRGNSGRRGRPPNGNVPGRLVDSINRQAMVDLAASGVPLASPTEAYFEVANRCNSKCVTCPITFSPQENAKQLSLEEFKS